jgi:outer membrane receptor for ferrienterochelin and colicins
MTDGHKRIGVLAAILVPLILGGGATPALAQGLQSLSLEELMQVDSGRVFGAAERLQPVTEAPASVSFVTAEEIKRYGYKTLADILRGVRGMIVTDDRNFSFVGIRGFGKPGDYNSRILLLIDGHRVNDNVYGQAEVGSEFGLDPSLFERIEIIRGPASALYGDSAFFAVVNVITKTGASLAGESLTVESGSYGTDVVRGSVGRRLSNGIDFALAGTLERSSGVPRLYFPDFDTPATNNGIANHLDGQRLGEFYGRFQFGNFTFTSAYGRRQKDVPTASYGTIFNEQQFKEQTTDRHTLVDGEYLTTLASNTRLSLRASFDRFTYDGLYPFSTDLTPAGVMVALNQVVGDRWTVGGRVVRALSKGQTLTAGAEFIDNTSALQASQFVDPANELFRLDQPSHQSAVYAQHELALPGSVHLTSGIRYDQYEAFSKVTPRLAGVWMPTHDQSFKYLYGRAFRAPNAYESNAFYFGDSVAALRPETIDTHEVVWERYTGDWLRTSVSGYWYKADHLITLVPDPVTALQTTYVNEGQVRAKGLEVEAQFRGTRRLEGMLSYALQEATDQYTGASLPNSPRHMFKARASMPIVARGSSVAAEVLAIGPRSTLAGTMLPTATTANATVVQPLARSFELFGTLRNLFNVQYADPVSSSLLQNVIYQNGRTFQVGLRLTTK